MNADDELISEIGAKYLLCMIIRQVCKKQYIYSGRISLIKH